MYPGMGMLGCSIFYALAVVSRGPGPCPLPRETKNKCDEHAGQDVALDLSPASAGNLA